MISQRIIFEGRVQGVGFRYGIKEMITGYDLVGTVKNLDNGNVELLIKGEQSEIDHFLKEIIEESSLSHHIKNMDSSKIEDLGDIIGFTIAG